MEERNGGVDCQRFVLRIPAMLIEQFPSLQKLTATDKLKLADELTEMAIEAAEASLRTELRASLAAYRANPHDVVPWDQVKAGLRKPDQAATSDG